MSANLSCDPCYDHYGERWYIIAVVYTVVFLPWTIIQAVDFIGPEWKSVRHTRRNGKSHFWWTLIPIGFIVAYIYFQISAEDYKEAAVAVIALIIGLRHLMNTIWGLWQLEHFREWAADSITTLKRLGIPFDLGENHRDRHDDESERQYHLSLADRIKVNECIVDNQILYGATPCYVVKGEGQNAREFMKTSKSAHKSLESAFSGFFLSAQACLITPYSLFRPRSKSITDAGVWHQRPRDPVKVWINWATAFTGQGCVEWLQNFDVESDPPPTNPDCVSMDPYNKAQNFYARELLSTAILMFPIDKSKQDEGVEDPFAWLDKAASDGSISLSKIGKLSKEELFKFAVKSGRGLPFQAPQIEDLTRDFHGSSNAKHSFVSYSYLVQQAAGSMRAEFGDHVDRLTVDALEWLTILLSLGPFEPYSPARNTKFNRLWVPGKMSDLCASCFQALRGSNWRSPLVDSENPSASYFSQGQDEELFESSQVAEAFSHQLNRKLVHSNRDIAVSNLRGQLGLEKSMPHIVRKRPVWSSIGLSKIPNPEFSFLSFPCRQLVKPELFSGNKNVLKVSSMLDSWRSLLSGDAINIVLQNDNDWAQITRRSPLTPNLSSHHIEERSKRLFSANSTLQKISLLSQYTCPSSDYDVRFSETIGFVGTIVERVRSRLAQGIHDGTIPNSDWYPPITFDTNLFGDRLTKDLLEFTLTKSLSDSLRKSAGFYITSSEPVAIPVRLNRISELRVLSELQQACLQFIGEDKCSPESEVAMLALIIGFPSLCFEEKMWVNGSKLSMTIVPCCAPQDLAVRLSVFFDGVQCQAKALLISASESHFDWSAWRDAIGGRMHGLHQWRQKHSIEPGLFINCEGELSSRIVSAPLDGRRGGVELYVWLKWLPFIPHICEFERIPRQSGRIQFNSKLTNLQLTSLACSVVTEVHQQRHMYSSDPDNRIHDDSLITTLNDALIKEADDILKAEEPDFSAAMSKFEIAAQRGSVKGFQKFMSIMLHQTVSATKMNRTIALFEEFKNYIDVYERLLKPEKSSVPIIFEMFELMVSKFSYNPKIVLSYYDFWVFTRCIEFDARCSSTLTHFPILPKTSTISNTLRKSFLIVRDNELLTAISDLVAFCGSIQNTSPYGWFESFPGKNWGAWTVGTFECRKDIPLHVKISIHLKSSKDWDWAQGIPKLKIVYQQKPNTWTNKLDLIILKEINPLNCYFQGTEEKVFELLQTWCGFSSKGRVHLLLGELFGTYEGFGTILSHLEEHSDFPNSSFVKFASQTYAKWGTFKDRIVGVFIMRKLYLELGDIYLSGGLEGNLSDNEEAIRNYVNEVCCTSDRQRFKNACRRLLGISLSHRAGSFRNTIIKKLTTAINENKISKYRHDVVFLLGKILCESTEPVVEDTTIAMQLYENSFLAIIKTWSQNSDRNKKKTREDFFSSFLQALKYILKRLQDESVVSVPALTRAAVLRLNRIDSQLLANERLRLALVIPNFITEAQFIASIDAVSKRSDEWNDPLRFDIMKDLFYHPVYSRFRNEIVARLETCFNSGSFYAAMLLAHIQSAFIENWGRDVYASVEHLSCVIVDYRLHDCWPNDPVDSLSDILLREYPNHVIDAARDALHKIAVDKVETKARLRLANFYLTGPSEYRDVTQAVALLHMPYIGMCADDRRRIVGLVELYFDEASDGFRPSIMQVFEYFSNNQEVSSEAYGIVIETLLALAPDGHEALKEAIKLYSRRGGEKSSLKFLDLSRSHEQKFHRIRAEIIEGLASAARLPDFYAFGALSEISGDTLRLLNITSRSRKFEDVHNSGGRELKEMEDLTRKICEHTPLPREFHKRAFSHLTNIYFWITESLESQDDVIGSEAWLGQHGLLKKIEKALTTTDFPLLQADEMRLLSGKGTLKISYNCLLGTIESLGSCAINNASSSISSSPMFDPKRPVNLLLTLFKNCGDYLKEGTNTGELQQQILHTLLLAGEAGNKYAMLGIASIYLRGLKIINSSDLDLGINALGMALQKKLWKAAEETIGLFKDMGALEQNSQNCSQIQFSDDRNYVSSVRIFETTERKERIMEMIRLSGINIALHGTNASIAFNHNQNYNGLLQAIGHHLDGIEVGYWPSVKSLDELLEHPILKKNSTWSEDRLEIVKRLSHNLGYIALPNVNNYHSNMFWKELRRECVPSQGYANRGYFPECKDDRVRMAEMLALGCLISHGCMSGCEEVAVRIVQGIQRDGDKSKGEVNVVHEHYAAGYVLWHIARENDVDIVARENAKHILSRWARDDDGAGLEFYGALLGPDGRNEDRNLELAAQQYGILLKNDESTLSLRAKSVFLDEGYLQAMESLAAEFSNTQLSRSLLNRAKCIRETRELDYEEIDSYLTERV